MKSSHPSQTIWFLTILLLSGAAWGNSSQFPGPLGSDPREHQPNDPDYPDLWHLFSYIPTDHIGPLSPQEQGLGSGMNVDLAWQMHTGSPQTLIAVLDSGVKWDSDDIRDRVYINTGEVPKPLGSATYDKNRDGRISISDYESDPRVSDLNHNGTIDVGDLILAFSDGIDEDGNGYIDDISGWDFHEHDNDPADRIRFGHGTGEAKDSVGQADNGIGGVGGCPNCSVVFLRVNDSFVVDANSFAAAVHYATDKGASVIQEALGSLNHNDNTQEAVNYAWNHDVIVIGSAADENSSHHNYPATLDPVIYVNAMRYDAQNMRDATTFMAFNNCSNYGARVDVAASGIACSSEATGNLSGIAALASSYAHSLGIKLTAGELSALIRTTATDVNFGSNAVQPSRHSTWKGWDKMTGYGRVDANAILTAIRTRHIPPHLRILSPSWFALYRHGQEGQQAFSIPVEIELKSRDEQSVHLKVEVARGVETSASNWQLLKEIDDLPPLFSGNIADISSTKFDALPANQLDSVEDQNSVTIKVTAQYENGIRTESRRTVQVFHSNSLHRGFPVKLNGSGESSGLFVDLNADGKQEFVTADGSGFLHAFTFDGHEMPGFPINATEKSHYGSMLSAVYAPIAATDLDGDGTPEIVVASLEGSIAVVSHDGKLLDGSPFQLPFPQMATATEANVIAQGIFASPVLADLDVDGKKDMIVASADGSIYVFDIYGHIKSGWPYHIEVDGISAKILSSPAVYDINADGIPDLVFGTNHKGPQAGLLFALDGRGKNAASPMLRGFPVRIPLLRDALLPTVGTGIPTSPAIADIDGDGKREILIHGFAGKPYIVNFDGTIRNSLSLSRSTPDVYGDKSIMTGFGNPAFANVSGNGMLSPVTLSAGSKILVSMLAGGLRIPYNYYVSAWNPKTNVLIPDRIHAIDDIPLMPSPISVDLDGDGLDEILVGTGGSFIHAFTANGEEPGFPEFTGGWMLGSLSVGDIDGDGNYDIAGTTREGYAFVWKTKGKIPQNGRGPTWPTFKGNNARTGVQGEPK